LPSNWPVWPPASPCKLQKLYQPWVDIKSKVRTLTRAPKLLFDDLVCLVVFREVYGGLLYLVVKAGDINIHALVWHWHGAADSDLTLP
jgi:hypothetical protein